MTTLSDPPPWTLEPCPDCGRPLPLDTYELTCPCFDSRTRIAVAWICDDCDLIVGVVGLFTTWHDAISARQRLLDERGARYLREPPSSVPTITAERRRNVTTESRRYSPE